MAVNIVEYLRTKNLAKKRLLEYIRRKRLIVYGSQSINAQSKFPLRRQASDYDVFSKNPKKSANEIDRELDEERGGDYHYVKPAEHRGTYKVMDIGHDLKPRTSDDFNWADVTKTPSGLKTNLVGGIRYADLDYTKKAKKRIVKQKKYSYRHKKDMEDIKLIKAIQKRKWWI
jgi:hypothetical protein